MRTPDLPILVDEGEGEEKEIEDKEIEDKEKKDSDLGNLGLASTLGMSPCNYDLSDGCT